MTSLRRPLRVPTALRLPIPLRLPAWCLRLLQAMLMAGVFWGGPAAAQTFPKLTGLVVDAANVLPDSTKADLTAKLQALQRDTHRQLVVATIPDLQGQPLEDYGYKLGRAWGIGLKGVDNGAILFIAPNEPAGHRGPRIEVGYGLEPVLTDAMSSVIINTQMLPKLKAGDVPGAMEAGIDAIVTQLRLPDDQAKARTDAAVAAFDKAHKRSGQSGGLPIGLIFWVMIIAFVALSWFRRGSGGSRFRDGIAPAVLWGSALGGWGGGSGGGGGGGGSSDDGGWGGGGFSGGGGGSFGGGGASGDW